MRNCNLKIDQKTSTGSARTRWAPTALPWIPKLDLQKRERTKWKERGLR